jgi:hypothetical protein
VRNWFQNFAFFKCNLQHYTAAYSVSDPFGFATADHLGREAALDPDAREWLASPEFKVGLCTS